MATVETWEHVPAGEWYGVAWGRLDANVQRRLANATRRLPSGRVITIGATPDTPVTVLGEPDKMPGYSWAMTAGATCPGALFGPGTICGSCYAGGAAHRADAGQPDMLGARRRGYVTRLHVRRALAVREWWARLSAMTPDGMARWADRMAATIARASAGAGQRAGAYFRIHDAGDFFAPRYVRMWAAVCQMLPSIRFWGPTRSWRFAERPIWGEAFAEINALPNVAISPSALRVGDPAPVVPGFARGSTVLADGAVCPARFQGGHCGECRRCWDPNEERSYPLH